MLTSEEVINILEALKDRINDDGKRELGLVQGWIREWKMMSSAPQPAPKVVPVPDVPKAPAIKHAIKKAPEKEKAKKKK